MEHLLAGGLPGTIDHFRGMPRELAFEFGQIVRLVLGDAQRPIRGAVILHPCSVSFPLTGPAHLIIPETQPPDAEPADHRSSRLLGDDGLLLIDSSLALEDHYLLLVAGGEMQRGNVNPDAELLRDLISELPHPLP